MTYEDPIRETVNELMTDPDADAAKAPPPVPPQTIDAEPAREREKPRD